MHLYSALQDKKPITKYFKEVSINCFLKDATESRVQTEGGKLFQSFGMHNPP